MKIWVHDEKGNELLYSLAEADVGAIYPGSADTPFELKNNNNELLGVIRSSGFYLTQDNQVKSVQQLDLVV